jgi:hypothetical protein
MISPLRLNANRRNALRSTGPRTEEGKQRSRANALRHGLTAETVVPNLEDAEDYKAFEATIVSDYCPETAVGRELVLRLASPLWRLRRATAIETQLLDMHAELLGPDVQEPTVGQQVLRNSDSGGSRNDEKLTEKALRLCETGSAAEADRAIQHEMAGGRYALATRQLALCFLDLTNQDPGVFERLSRYETALWRQAVQIICVLDPIRTTLG